MRLGRQVDGSLTLWLVVEEAFERGEAFRQPLQRGWDEGVSVAPVRRFLRTGAVLSAPTFRSAYSITSYNGSVRNSG